MRPRASSSSGLTYSRPGEHGRARSVRAVPAGERMEVLKAIGKISPGVTRTRPLETRWEATAGGAWPPFRVVGPGEWGRRKEVQEAPLPHPGTSTGQWARDCACLTSASSEHSSKKQQAWGPREMGAQLPRIRVKDPAHSQSASFVVAIKRISGH